MSQRGQIQKRKSALFFVIRHPSFYLPSPMSPLDENLRDWIAADLADIGGTFMPFGKYGPEHYPPHGVPLFDLPLEYLCWFEKKGWPQGRIGELLRMLHQLKTDGCDEIFDRFRKARGGRTSLRER